MRQPVADVEITAFFIQRQIEWQMPVSVDEAVEVISASTAEVIARLLREK